MRIWRVTTDESEQCGAGKERIELALLLNNSLNAAGSADGPRALTSFDWNQADPSLLVTASLETPARSGAWTRAKPWLRQVLIIQ